jgi:hypothetical protein
MKIYSFSNFCLKPVIEYTHKQEVTALIRINYHMSADCRLNGWFSDF